MTATEDRLAQVPYPRGAEREQRAMFDEPGAANREWPAGAARDDHTGGFLAHPPTDAVDQRVQAKLDRIPDDLRPDYETAGRRVSDRLAEDDLRRRELVETSHDVSEGCHGAADRFLARQQMEHAREAQQRPRGDDFVGVNQLSDAGYRRWVEHCAAGWGGPPHLLLDPDDLELDAARDHGWGIDGDDLHFRSPDLDDLNDDTDGD